MRDHAQQGGQQGPTTGGTTSPTAFDLAGRVIGALPTAITPGPQAGGAQSPGGVALGFAQQVLGQQAGGQTGGSQQGGTAGGMMGALGTAFGGMTGQGSDGRQAQPGTMGSLTGALGGAFGGTTTPGQGGRPGPAGLITALLGTAGGGVTLASSSPNPVGTVQILIRTIDSQRRGEGCTHDAEVVNGAASMVTLGDLPAFAVDAAGVPRDTRFVVPRLAPNERRIVRVMSLRDCNQVRSLQFSSGGPNEWPNACRVNDAYARPCPVSIQIRSERLAISRQ